MDILTMKETVELARDAMRSRRRLQHVALNVAKLVNMRSDPALAGDVASSDVISIDGMGIVWGARVLGIKVSTRVTGVDLLGELLGVCAREGFKPYFLGATPTTLQEAIKRALATHPSLVFAGSRDGYFAGADEAAVVRDIQLSQADCLFIGMPTPRKERFLAAHRDELGVPFIMGVGGSFDILSGRVHRAPPILQRSGLEWLYRIYQEPRRMWWRYAKTNTVFAGLIAQAMIRRMLGAAPPPPSVLPPSAHGMGG